MEERVLKTVLRIHIYTLQQMTKQIWYQAADAHNYTEQIPQ